MLKPLALGLAVAGLLATAPVANASSPLFDHATVQVNSPEQNKAVVGKGATANYYGYYGNYYNNLAGYYGNTGLYSNSYNSYYYAYLYSGYAQTNYYYAYIYSAAGY